MTIGTNNRSDAIGNGATATYSFNFKIFAGSDLRVTVRDTVGVETTLAYPADFSVSGVGVAAGGSITLADGNLEDGYAISIRRVRPITQTTDIRNQSEVFNDVLEDTYDHLVMIDQQQQDEIDRALRYPETDYGVSAVLPPASELAGGSLAFDANGEPIAGPPLGDLVAELDAAEQHAADANTAKEAAEAAQEAAETASAAAVAAQGAAEDAQEAAEDAEAGAVTARNEAETYASLLATGAPFFDTIALGLAGVADTESFGVVAGGSDGLTWPTIFRRDSAATYTLLFAIVPASHFSTLNDDPNVVFADVDSSGEWAAELTTPAGVKKIANAEILAALVTALTAGTLTTTGTATLETLRTALQEITTEDAGLLDELIADLDASGEWAAAAVLKDGRVRFGSVLTRDLEVTGELTVPSLTLTDLEVDRVGPLDRSMDAVVQGAVPTHPDLIADVCHLLGYGQSLSIGTQSIPALSTTQAHDSLMFDGGMRPQDAGTRTALTAAVEATFNTNWGETPMAGMAYAIKELLASEDGDPAMKLLLSADGEGGKKISELVEGTTYYERLEDSIAAGLSLCNAAGDTYNVPAMPYIQGENDASAGTSSASYAVACEGLRQQVQATVQAATGQSNPVWMLTGQTASHEAYGVAPNIPIGQYRANKDYPYVRICCPQYILAHAVIDNIHLTNTSSRKLGYYLGLFFKRIVIDRQDFKPVQPRRVTRQGSIVLVEFDMPTLPDGSLGELEFDTTLVAAATNQGFRLYESDGTTEITIDSVTITNKNMVKIVADSAVPAGAKLRYGTVGAVSSTSGPTSGPRGNLRDNYGAVVTINSTPMHNWCVMFEEVLP